MYVYTYPNLNKPYYVNVMAEDKTIKTLLFLVFPYLSLFNIKLHYVEFYTALWLSNSRSVVLVSYRNTDFQCGSHWIDFHFNYSPLLDEILKADFKAITKNVCEH